MKELSTEEMNAVRGGQTIASFNSIANTNVAVAQNFAAPQTNVSLFSISSQENESSQHAKANAGNISA
jgi:hypothetical protein